MSIQIKRLMESISKRTVTFLKEEMNIEVNTQDIKLVKESRLELNHLTSVITVGTAPHIFVIFSYEKELIDKIFEAYTQEIDVLPEEKTEYIEETAGDMLNIVVGNVISEFDTNGKAINLSTPIVITDAQSIAKSRTVKFFINNLGTSYGNMSIFCVGPNELFEM
ncbi:MAG: chemotaxis protein CheX [Desulfamplus sp.]|nr:chemotaxis protein CheX [Desulfamplus sp.]